MIIDNGRDNVYVEKNSSAVAAFVRAGEEFMEQTAEREERPKA